MSSRQLVRCALLLAVLGALGVQQWAAQAHWLEHLPGGQIAAEAGEDSGDGAPVHDCRWCQIASHGAGAAPPPTALRIPARDQLLSVPVAANPPAGLASSPAWAWQSRGPPSA